MSTKHYVTGAPLRGPFPKTTTSILFGMGCFWGAERLFWETSGVYSTAVGYAGGTTSNPTYEAVCSGHTGHTEVVSVTFEPGLITLPQLLRLFWENHDPTQGMRQGNDIGSQYRSAIYTSQQDHFTMAQDSARRYEAALETRQLGPISTEIRHDVAFYFAEDYHQQYLAKNPHGYCALRGTGIPCIL